MVKKESLTYFSYNVGGAETLQKGSVQKGVQKWVFHYY